jgi:hypothetical protein
VQTFGQVLHSICNFTQTLHRIYRIVIIHRYHHPYTVLTIPTQYHFGILSEVHSIVAAFPIARHPGVGAPLHTYAGTSHPS